MLKVNIEEMIRKKFGRLTVIEFIGYKNHRDMYKCICDCGNKETIKEGRNLRFGNAKSCGCLQREKAAEVGRSTRGKVGVWRGVTGENHPMHGYKASDEVREQMSKSRKGLLVGEKNPMFGKYGELNHMYGKKHTEKTKRKISEYNKKYYSKNKSPMWLEDRSIVLKNKRIIQFIHNTSLAGYTTKELISHLENLWKPGMSWDNYGQGIGKWCIDHIIPISYFIDNGVTGPKTINALSNLQPLWWEENARKNNKIL